MTWKVEFDDRAAKELRKLDRQIQQDILRYLRERIATEASPRHFGKPLTGDRKGLWRYRLHSYRIICHIGDASLIVLVVRVGDRKNVYI